jgi:hypothetical protein
MKYYEVHIAGHLAGFKVIERHSLLQYAFSGKIRRLILELAQELPGLVMRGQSGKKPN